MSANVVLGVCCLLAAFLKSEGAGCTFLFPSTTNSSQCEGYDLSKISSLGGVNFTSTSSYALTVCENLPTVGIPLVCRFQSPAPAYVYGQDSCFALGNLNSPFAVSSKKCPSSDKSARCLMKRAHFLSARYSIQWIQVTARWALGLATAMEVCVCSLNPWSALCAAGLVTDSFGG